MKGVRRVAFELGWVGGAVGGPCPVAKMFGDSVGRDHSNGSAVAVNCKRQGEDAGGMTWCKVIASDGKC